MYIYFFILLFLLYCSYNQNRFLHYNQNNIILLGRLNKNSIFLVLFSGLLIASIIGLKDVSVGSDTISYYYRYENSLEMMTSEAVQSEMGYNYLNLIFHDFIGLPWQIFLYFLSFIIIGCTLLFIKRYSDDIFYSFFIYITIGLFTMDMSGIRQSLAISICYSALIYLEYKEESYRNLNPLAVKTKLSKYRKYLLPTILLLLSVSFHNSSIIFLLVFFIRHFRLTKRQVTAILIIAISSLFYKDYVTSLIPTLEGTRYSQLEFEEEYAINPLVILVTISIPMAAVFFIPTEKDGRFTKRLSLMFLFSALNIFFRILSINQVLLGRLSDYFMNCYLVLIPVTIYSLRSDKKVLFKLLISLLCLIMFYLGTKGGTYKIDNYKFFWQ